MIISGSIRAWVRNHTLQDTLRLMGSGEVIVFMAEEMTTADSMTVTVLTAAYMYVEVERERRSIQQRELYKRKAAAGEYTPRVYFGYVPGTFTPDENRKYIVEMFLEASQGVEPDEIAEWMNDCGLRTVRGNEFTARAVRAILHNPVYCGDVGTIVMCLPSPRLYFSRRRCKEARSRANETLKKGEINMVKVITRMGLLFMDPEERKARLDALMDGNAIHCDKVGELIDACKDKCYELTARESEAVSEQEKIKIRWMLTRIDGLKVARQMNPDELAEWVLDLRENGTIFSKDDLRKVAGAMMKMG